MDELRNRASAAVINAGVKVVLLPEDSAFKPGPCLTLRRQKIYSSQGTAAFTAWCMTVGPRRMLWSGCVN